MGQLSIPSSATVYIDTSVLIYTVEGNPNYYSLLQPLWLKFQAGEIEIISSELILLEVLVQPFKNGDKALISDYETILLSSAMRLIPISKFILKDAAHLRATTSLKTPNAIHAATALVANCTMFLTNDKNLGSLPNLPVVILSEVLTS